MELLIPALCSVFMIIAIGFSDSLWAPLAWKAARSWLTVWLALLESLVLDVLELLDALELLSESDEAP